MGKVIIEEVFTNRLAAERYAAYYENKARNQIEKIRVYKVRNKRQFKVRIISKKDASLPIYPKSVIR